MNKEWRMTTSLMLTLRSATPVVADDNIIDADLEVSNTSGGG